jgi:hypothetical protein
LLIYLTEAERCLHDEALALGSVRVSSICCVIYWPLSITHFYFIFLVSTFPILLSLALKHFDTPYNVLQPVPASYFTSLPSLF